MTAASARPAPSALALVFALAPLPNFVHVLVEYLSPDGVAVDRLIGAVGGLLWMLLVPAVPSLRRFAAELGAWLLARVGLGVWILGSLIAALLATQREFDAAWSGVAMVALPLAAIATVRAWQGSRARLARLGIGVVAVVAALVVLDRTVGMWLLMGKSHNSIYLAHDPILGWRLRAGLALDRTFKGHPARESINGRGFRTPERAYEKAPGVKRVVLLGDSHTEAYTVGDDETYARELERALDAQLEAPVEVISLGVGGYSTDQELLSYVVEGRRYKPDLVLLQFCPNDPPFVLLDRYWRGLKPRFERHGEQLFLQGVPAPDRRSSGLLNHALLRGSSFAKIVEGFFARMSLTESVRETDEEESWRVVDLLIRDLAEMVQQDGARFAVFNSNPDDLRSDGRLRELLARRGIAFVDITPAFGGDIVAHRIEEDHHWNPRGHRAVAALLAEQVLPELD
jgi:lysophospholipase L1-like esterase